MLLEAAVLLLKTVGAMAALGSDGSPGDGAQRIPAFARRYRVSCARCHTAAPKLNGVGEAFRLNGYSFPEGEPPVRGEPPIPLGEEPWKDLWPRGIWPGELSASAPVAVRLVFDLEVARDRDGRTAMTFQFPHELALLAGGSLGEHIGAFIEGEWSRDDGFEIGQAKLAFQRLLAPLGERLVNLWVGLQNLYLFTFADPQIDRAGRQPFLWQRFRSSEVLLTRGATELVPGSEFGLGHSQPAITMDGLITPRLYYAVGLAQGPGGTEADNNRRKDLYFKARYKAGGIGLDGSHPASGRLVSGAFGQLYERALIVETFGYFGHEPSAGEGQSRHRELGLSGRLLRGPLDLGVGYVWGRDDEPWGAGLGSLNRASLFTKGEYLVFPWLIASVKGERLTIRTPPPGGAGGRVTFTQSHLMPGLVALVRQNVRLVAEADLFLDHESPSGARTPAGLWLRLDVAF